MSVHGFVGLIALVAAISGCAADDTNQGEATSEKADQTAHGLSDPGGMGQDLPAPMPAGPWDDGDWKPPVDPARPHVADPDQLDDLGNGLCGYGYQKIYDPGRGRYISVLIVNCQ